MTSSNKTNPEKLAVVLIAHGSRNADANADAFWFAEQLLATGIAGHLETAFLELAEPDIATAVRRCLQTAPEVVVLLPCFVSSGVHVRATWQECASSLRMHTLGVRFVLAEPLGRHALMTNILAERLREAVAETAPAGLGSLGLRWRLVS